MLKFQRKGMTLLAFLVLFAMISGCSAKTAATQDQTSTKTEDSIQTNTGTVEDAGSVDEAGTNTDTREITDMEGRTVTIPAKVNKVISLSNNTTVYVFTLAPDKLLGWSFTPKEAAKKYIKDEYFNLPNVGSSTQKSGSFENILKLKPDLIICSNEDEVYKPDELQKQLNIPVVMVNVSLESTDKVYSFLGDCLNEQERGKQLADYSRNILDTMKEQINKVPEDKKLKVYYAEGAAWLQTDIAKNVHTEVLDFAAGMNVANISEDKVGSMAEVSMEQVLEWDPDIILVGATATKGDFYSKVYSDANWGKIKAVKNQKIYKIPALPFNWFDRPPCPARILGVEWLANLLYPDYVKLDLSTEIKNFYETFYHYKLTDSEIQDLLKDAAAKG